MRIGRIALNALGFLAFALMATAFVLWVAASFGVQPFATWMQTAGSVLMLFLLGYALLIVTGSVLYGLYYALRHIRDWPHGARFTMTFLKGRDAEADIVRAVLAIIAIVLLFSAAHTYYGCHFAHGCWTMPMMARSDNRAMEFAGSGVAVWAFVAWLRGAKRWL